MSLIDMRGLDNGTLSCSGRRVPALLECCLQNLRSAMHCSLISTLLLFSEHQGWKRSLRKWWVKGIMAEMHLSSDVLLERCF